MLNTELSQYVTPCTSERLSALKPVLDRWVKITKQCFAGGMRPERWNTEATLVGHFAAAVLAEGGSVLQELSVRRSRGAGRLDLWFGLGSVSYVVESKVHRLERKSDFEQDRIVDELNNLLDEALAEAERISLSPGPDRRLALVFASRYPWSSQYGSAEQLRLAFVKAVYAVQRVDMRAVVIHGDGLGSELPDGYCHMGTALLGRLVSSNIGARR